MAQLDAPSTGFGVALLVSAFAFGFRHGIDWDHIAAITDITSSQRDVRTGLRLATLYAAGHGAVVFLIGVVAIAARRSLPESVDTVMGRVVGATLVILGVYVVYALIRYREDFRLRSRWMLVFAGVRRGYRWFRRRLGGEPASFVHTHEHAAGGIHHEVRSSSGPIAVATHAHEHSHTDPFANYGTGTSLLVGALHGVGAETPTQVVIFLAAAGAGGVGAGIAVLATFLVGLFAANSALAVASASGFLTASRRFPVYAAVSVVTAAASLVLGVSLLLGAESWLPGLF